MRLQVTGFGLSLGLPEGQVQSGQRGSLGDLLADEPTGNLDPATSTAVFDSLYALARREGVAAVVATHNLALAGHIDRVFALRNGRMEVWAG